MGKAKMTKSYDIEKLRKTSRYSAIAGLLGFLIIASSLIYSSYKLYNLRKELGNLEQKRTELLSQLEQLEGKTEKARKEFELARNELSKVLSNLSNIQPQSVTASDLTQQVSRLEQIDRKIETAKRELDAPRLYIHIQKESQRERAKGIAEKLKEMGYIVPGIERAVSKAETNQVRYFRSEEKTEATKIADILKRLGLDNVEPAYIGGYEEKVKPRHYEIWFISEF